MVHSLSEMSVRPNLVAGKQALPSQRDGQNGPGKSLTWDLGIWDLGRWLGKSLYCCYLQLTYLELLRSCLTIAGFTV